MLASMRVFSSRNRRGQRGSYSASRATGPSPRTTLPPSLESQSRLGPEEVLPRESERGRSEGHQCIMELFESGARVHVEYETVR